MVFQNYALYPHMTVAANMGFALKMAKVEKHERQERVREAAKLLDLEDYLTRKPRALCRTRSRSRCGAAASVTRSRRASRLPSSIRAPRRGEL